MRQRRSTLRLHFEPEGGKSISLPTWAFWREADIISCKLPLVSASSASPNEKVGKGPATVAKQPRLGFVGNLPLPEVEWFVNIEKELEQLVLSPACIRRNFRGLKLFPKMVK